MGNERQGSGVGVGSGTFWAGGAACGVEWTVVGHMSRLDVVSDVLHRELHRKRAPRLPLKIYQCRGHHLTLGSQ